MTVTIASQKNKECVFFYHGKGKFILSLFQKAGSVFLQRIPGATANSSAVDAGYNNGGYQSNDAETVSLGEKILPKAVQILSLDSEVLQMTCLYILINIFKTDCFCRLLLANTILEQIKNYKKNELTRESP